MKFIVFILSCVALIAQDDPCFTAQYNTLTSNQIFSLAPYAWYASTTGVYTNGTTVPDNGGRVFQWLDISGNNNHIGSATLANRPKYWTNFINGYPAIDFGSGNYGLTNGAWSPSILPPVTVFAVFYLSNSGVSSYLFRGNSSTARPAITFGPDGTIIAGAVSLFAVQFDCWNVLSSLMVSNALSREFTNSNVSLNLKRTWRTDNGQAGIPWNVIGVGGNSLGEQLRGYIAEFIFFNRELNDSVVIGIELYLRTKYDLKYPL